MWKKKPRIILGQTHAIRLGLKTQTNQAPWGIRPEVPEVEGKESYHYANPTDSQEDAKYKGTAHVKIF